MSWRAMVFLMLISLGLAQSPARPEFEVASIKPNTSTDPNRTSVGMGTGGRFHAENAPLRLLIVWAYDLKDFQISGGPSWISSDRFDVSTTAEGNVTLDHMRVMLQSLLADRFKLALHRETKELPVYELVEAKGGLRLAASTTASCVKADPKNPPPPPGPANRPFVSATISISEEAGSTLLE